MDASLFAVLFLLWGFFLVFGINIGWIFIIFGLIFSLLAVTDYLVEKELDEKLEEYYEKQGRMKWKDHWDKMLSPDEGMKTGDE